jgi:voltage-gated potassium channel
MPPASPWSSPSTATSGTSRLKGERVVPVEAAGVDERSERIQQRFEWPVVIAAAATIPILFIQESGLDGPWTTIGVILNWGAWLTFALETVVMLWVVPKKRAWLRSHVIDVLVTAVTPPFAPAAWQAGRVFRLVRLIRLFRLFSLRNLLSLEGMRYAALTAAGTVLVGGAVVASIESGEGWTTWDGIWWAATTVTTVGYGDLQVTADSARIIAMAIMLIGIGFVALLTAFIADRFIQGQQETAAKEEAILAELRAIRSKLESLESQQ